MQAHNNPLNPEVSQQDFVTLSVAINSAFQDSVDSGAYSDDVNHVFSKGHYLIHHNNLSNLSAEQKLKNLAMIFTGTLIYAMHNESWNDRPSRFQYPLHNHLWRLAKQAEKSDVQEENDFTAAIGAVVSPISDFNTALEEAASPFSHFNLAKEIMNVGKLVVEGKLPFSLLMWDEMWLEKAKSLRKINNSKRLFVNPDLEQSVQDILIDGFNIKPSMLESLEDAVTLHHSFSPLHRAGEKIIYEARTLMMKLNTEADKQELVRLLHFATVVLRNPLDEHSVKALQLNAATSELGKPVLWKKFFGTLKVLAGVALLALGVAGMPLIAGVGVAGMYVGGSLLAAGGAALFYSGTQGRLSKSLSQLATASTKEIEARAVANLTP